MVERLWDTPMLLRRLWTAFWTNGINALFMLRMAFVIVGGLLYVCLPVDLLPEAVLGVGALWEG